MSKLAKMFITIELAHTLRDEYGWEDSKITEELSGSEELNARAWAIQQVLHGDLSLPTTSQEAFFDFMAQPKLPEKGKNEDEQAVLQAYRQYLNHETDERFRLKLNPALRFDAAVNPKKYIMGSTNSNADDYLDSETNT